MNTPEQIRDWAHAIDEQHKDAPTVSEVVQLLYDYAEVLDDMTALTRILHKWGP